MNKMKKNLQSNILLLPALIAGFFCYLFPILIAFGKSFFLGTGTDFVGIQNYVDLFENEAFSLAVRNLFHLWAIIVPVNLVIGIFIAEVYIKLPIIKSSLLICGILTIYNSFRCFREAYLIGGSHPNEQLYSIQHFLQNNFMNMNYARLEAASILVVIFVGAFILSGMCLARKKRNN